MLPIDNCRRPQEGETMKLNRKYVLVETGGEYMAVPVEDTGNGIRGIVRLNETGKIIWDGVAAGWEKAAIVSELLARYEVDEESAAEAVEGLLRQMIAAGIAEA